MGTNRNISSNFSGFDRQTVSELIRSRTSGYSVNTDSQVDEWVGRKLEGSTLRVRPVPLDTMQGWRIDPCSGNIEHETGRFFSFIGLGVRHRTDAGELDWDQPIIDQPEVGILGILAKKIDGVIHFCLQAKEEPGNLNSVQLSPTVQATFSNFTRAHGGSLPLFVEYFLNPGKARRLFSKQQTEDGGRFLYKSNRNMVVMVGDTELETLPEGFIWLTLGQIARLMRRDNLIHATTRSVLSSLLLPAGSDADDPGSHAEACPDLPSLWETLQWFDDCKASNHMLVKRKGLNSLNEWTHCSDGEFCHREGRFFRIRGIEATATGREVSGWHQPIIANPDSGIIGMLMREEHGRRRFLMQAKAEAGNRTTVQLGPTVQFSKGNYLHNPRLHKPFLFEEFSSPARFRIVSQSMQAEEGARFYRESNCHRVLMLPDGEELAIPEDFRWISEDEAQFFLHLGETVNSCCRSIVSCLL